MRSITWWRRAVVVTGALVAVMAIGPARRAAGQQPEDASPSPGPMDDTNPGTFTLDRMDAHTRFGVQVGFNKIDDTNVSDGFAMRFEPHGQLLFPNRMVGVYGALPIARLFDLTDGGGSGTGVGNFDGGAFFLPFQRSNLILRVGLVLPTATDSGVGNVANFITSFERITDLVLSAPNYTLLRLSGSTVQESDQMFVRADFGLDVAIDKPAGGSAVFGRVNVAAGVRVPGFDLAAELANFGALDGEPDVPDRFFHTFALGLRTRGADQFHAGVVFPLDEIARGEIWIVSLGYLRALN